MSKLHLVGTIAVSAALALTLAGCGGNSSQQSNDAKQDQAQEQTQQQEKKTANVGEEVTVQTEYGDLAITVEGFETNAQMTEQYKDYSWFGSGNTFGALLFTIENKSYDNTNMSPKGTVPLASYMTVMVDGASVTQLNSGNTYSSYENLLSSYMKDFTAGSKKKCAYTYALPTVPSQVVVKAGDTEITVPVTAK